MAGRRGVRKPDTHPAASRPRFQLPPPRFRQCPTDNSIRSLIDNPQSLADLPRGYPHKGTVRDLRSPGDLLIVNISKLPKLVRNVGRLNEIVSIVSRYGLAPWLNDVSADWLQKLLRLHTADGQRIGDQSEAVRLRLAVEELGTTFIKLGQILSTRADLIGPEFAAELAKLQSGTPADDPKTAIATIEAGLGRPVDQLFAEFEENAFASASIGQVPPRLASGRHPRRGQGAPRGNRRSHPQ